MTALEIQSAMELKRARRIETAPDSFKELLSAAFKGNCTPRQAIKAQCAECIGFDRAAITTCTAYACPLWHFRPYQVKAKDGARKGNGAALAAWRATKAAKKPEGQ